MISKELSETLGFAVKEAKKRRHEYVSVEHVLFALLHDESGMDIIEKCGGSVENLKRSLEHFFEKRIERIPEGSEYVLQQTIGFQRVIQHDTFLEPDECGGPVLDTGGRVIGINIARAGRVVSYLLPSTLVRAEVETMMSEISP